VRVGGSNAGPLVKHLSELDERGYRYYFQYTVLDNPLKLDPKTPRVEQAVLTFRSLSEHVGPARVIWRYDPIVLSNETGVDFHHEKFSAIASGLRGYTRRVVISLVDIYKSIAPRMRRLESEGLHMLETSPGTLEQLVGPLAEIASANDMEIQTCAEDLEAYGVKPGKCIDDNLIREVFKIPVTNKKDPNQRKLCGCVTSKDIGTYDTCQFNCTYCYATRQPLAGNCEGDKSGRITRIIAGGQTGADRGGLEAALYCGIPHGGWCPKGRKAEDGVIPAKYELRETPAADYARRTEANVADSDATLVFTRGKAAGGSKLTMEYAKKYKKPCLHIAIDQYSREDAVHRVKRWLEGEVTQPMPPDNCVLNIAGSRESEVPGIQEFVMGCMMDAINPAS